MAAYALHRIASFLLAALSLAAAAASGRAAEPFVLPAGDPAPSAPVQLAPAVQGRHPRLLFLPEDVAALRDRAKGESSFFFSDLESYLPSCKPPTAPTFITNATEAQRQGFWRLPTVALHYVITGNRSSFDRARGFLEVYLAAEHWETGVEEDCGMAAANNMIGAALAYDWLYNDLDAAFRDAVRAKLLLQARRMFYLGHLQNCRGLHFWQHDPQNNHRWHRDAGLALCALAVAGDDPAADWIVEQTRRELEFVYEWLPGDGTSHESPTSQIFGLSHLVLAFDAADRCLGTKFLSHPGLMRTPEFQIHSRTPGFLYGFNYGDSGEGSAQAYSHALFKAAATARDANAQAALLAYRQAVPKAFAYGWFGLVWFDPSLQGGSLEKMALHAFFPDLGFACFRDGWTADSAAMAFKCGPYGGIRLNEYRNARQGQYINVAHDDPDANSFMIYANGRMLAKSDGYSRKKTTASHNTILVDGAGQLGEGGKWIQPLANTDMLEMARIVSRVEDAGGAAIVEGEAGGAYKGLERYRRAVAWIPGSYILILDDIRAPQPRRLEWLVQSKRVETAGEGRWRLIDEKASLELCSSAIPPAQSRIADSPADAKDRSLDLKQLRLEANAGDWKVASVFDAWNRGGLTIDLAADGEGLRVLVEGPDFADRWTWTPAPDTRSASSFAARRDGQTLIDSAAKP